ncbi:MAG: TIR domain-containing protein [Bacteroidetes bacterium]|nr:MAG: TIR domain-containing protein [Bacteroidota bacterium]
MTDVEIIKKLEKIVGKKLHLLKQMWEGNGYTVNDDKKVTGVNLQDCELKELKDIASALIVLTNLTDLYLSTTQLSDITPLSGLTKLTTLYLDNTQLSDITPLSGLTNLTDLYLSTTQLSDITPLSGLNNLTILDLTNTQLRDITPLSGLTNLTTLYLDDTQLRDITPLSGLTNLTYLYLHNTQLSDITPLSGLTNLTYLFLSNNQLNNITPLSGLTNLTTLDLRDNQLSDIGALKGLTKLTNVYLENNPIENPPREIVNKGIKAIQEWFKEEKIYINEVKVLLVGHGEVGKTTLVKCLKGEKPNKKEQATHYINISKQEVRHKKKNVKLKYWDFGGQEMMHSTHQFFLSKRCLYILVLDGRRDEDPEYWLKHIESFGGNSPVLVVLNKIDTNPAFDVDRRFLQEKYKFIKGFYKTACFGKKLGINELKKGIIQALNEVEILSTGFLKSWLPVKNTLEEMTEPFISQHTYEGFCAEEGISETNSRETLAEYLNDLGIVVHFKDVKLQDMHILQPRWASRAAYKIITSKKVADSHGILKEDWLKEIMKKEGKDDYTYDPSVFPFILELMEKFELSYPLKVKDTYLISELLDIQQPPLPAHEGSVLKFYLQFEDLLPRSIMPRFIVRMHEDIKADLRWRTGVVLYVKEFDTTAIVIADMKERKINVTVSGKRKREHFAYIRKTIHDIRGSFEKLNVTEWLPLPDVDGYALEYDELIGYEESGKEEYFVGKLKKNYKVKDLLDGIVPENVRKNVFRWEVFLCHSSEDSDVLRLITVDLWDKGISYWLDSEQIRPGDNIIDKITDGILNSRNIVVCISQNQLKSGWSRVEYQAILQRIFTKQTEQKVIPFIIDDTSDDLIPPLLSIYRRERYRLSDEYQRLLEFLRRRI